MTTRQREFALMLTLPLVLSGCAGSLRSQPAPARWQTAFWYWPTRGVEAAGAAVKPDVLFVHTGTIWKSEYPLYVKRAAGSQTPAQSRKWGVSDEWPESLPEAHEYWLVFRQEQPGVPDREVAPMLAERVSQILKTARSSGREVAGIQLDIDCPTGSLAAYAVFLKEVRNHLPQGLGISVTALLDWFRDGTSVADVIRNVDEFVPQFYDVASVDQPGGSNDWHAIAARIDPAVWAPRFNRFGKRFRIGIATFGRARYVPKPDPKQTHGYGLRLFSDFTPIDIGSNPSFELRSSRTEANELILDYRPTRKVRVGYNDFEPGDVVQFILSTPEAVKAATGNARRIGGHCAGVVFFRWPLANENLVMQPADTLTAAGLAQAEPKVVAIQAVDGHCAVVSCVDLYLANTNPLSSKTIRYAIRGSTELEYFLPEQRVPARMLAPSEIEVTIPPYCGRDSILLGRAVTAARAEFKVGEEQ